MTTDIRLTWDNNAVTATETRIEREKIGEVILRDDFTSGSTDNIDGDAPTTSTTTGNVWEAGSSFSAYKRSGNVLGSGGSQGNDMDAKFDLEQQNIAATVGILTNATNSPVFVYLRYQDGSNHAYAQHYIANSSQNTFSIREVTAGTNVVRALGIMGNLYAGDLTFSVLGQEATASFPGAPALSTTLQDTANTGTYIRLRSYNINNNSGHLSYVEAVTT